MGSSIKHIQSGGGVWPDCNEGVTERGVWGGVAGQTLLSRWISKMKGKNTIKSFIFRGFCQNRVFWPA